MIFSNNLRPFMRQIAIFILLATALTAPYAAVAKEPEFTVRFGPEFTFKVKELGTEFFALERLVDRQSRHLIDGQPAGAKFKEETQNTFRSPNGWSFESSVDTYVVEVKMEPLPASVFRRFKS